MSLPKSLGLALAACVCVAAARQPIPNLYDNCEFIADRSRYDLCPLFHDRGRGGVVTVPADLAPAIQLSYEMSFGGPLSPQSGEEAGPQCPSGTWICLRERQTDSEDPGSHFTQAIPIAGNFAIGTPRATTSTRLEIGAYRSTHNGDLEIDLKGGMWRNKPQAAHFRFICDQNSQEPPLPAFVGITAGNHNFEWSTPHACAKEPLSFDTLEEGEDTTPTGNNTQPGGDGDGGQELVDTFPAHHTARNLMIAFAVASSVILGLGYLIRCPPPKVRRWVGSAARKLPSQVGEGILVRWAEEAMFINDEEDVMVNYEEEYGSDEQIPLKPSPTRLSARFSDYGSARW